MISSKLVPIFSENSRFCDVHSCAVNVESLKNEIFHEFSAFFVSGQFSWALKKESEYSKNLSYDFSEENTFFNIIEVQNHEFLQIRLWAGTEKSKNSHIFWRKQS